MSMRSAARDDPKVPVWAQTQASSGHSATHHKFDLERLRREAKAKHQILEVTFFPDMDSVTNVDKLYDVDQLVEVEFIPVRKKAGK
jgi:hypothetical protein